MTFFNLKIASLFIWLTPLLTTLLINQSGFSQSDTLREINPTNIGAIDSTQAAIFPISNQESSFFIGYDEVSQKEKVGAIDKISSKDFNKGIISSPLLLVQGKIPGVQIYNRGGNPNGITEIRIRGIAAWDANQFPLIIIDGIVGSDLNNIDPNDIASIQVLKDGTATAMYGVQAANGVVVIQAKNGKEAKGLCNINYTGRAGFSYNYDGISVMNAQEFFDARGFNLRHDNEWLKEITQRGFSQTHGIALSGRKENTSYRIAGNYRSIEGVLKKSGFDLLNTRLNFSTKAFNKKLSLDINTAINNTNQLLGFPEAFKYAVTFNPTAPIYGDAVHLPFDSERYGGYYENIGLFDSFNPVAIIALNENKGRKKTIAYNVNLGYALSNEWTMNFRFAQQNQFSNQRTFYSPKSFFRGLAQNISNKGMAELLDRDARLNVVDLFGNYSKNYGKLALTITGGYSYQIQDFTQQQLSLRGLSDASLIAVEQINDVLNWEEKANIVNSNSTSSWEENLAAFFIRTQLSLDDFLFFNASIRREGSSKLGVNNKWGNFPAVGAAIHLNRFIKSVSIHQLKLRVGYGVTGGLPAPAGLSFDRPDLAFVKNAEVNMGLDFSIGKISGFVDAYQRTITALAFLHQIDAAVGGLTNVYDNSGKLNTQGVEVALDFELINKKNCKLNTKILYSKSRTKIKEYYLPYENLAIAGAPGQNFTNLVRVTPGGDFGDIIAPVFESIDSTGEPIFTDLNNDGQVFVGAHWDGVSEKDYKVLGNGIPDFELGWNTSLDIFGWSIHAFFRGAFGHSLVNTNRLFYEPNLSSQVNYNNVKTELAIDELLFSRYSSLYIEKASFFKLDNLTFAKTIPLNFGERAFSINISLTGQNLFTLTKYAGTDPEPALFDSSNGSRIAPGIDRRTNYYPSKSIVLGVDLSF